MKKIFSNNKLYLAKQVQEIERLAIKDKGIKGIDLMQKAGAVVFGLIQKYYPHASLVIFCGGGNNAGDGYVVAKMALEAGMQIKLYFLSKPENLRGDALIAYQIYTRAGGIVNQFHPKLVLTHCLVVDALFGTGLNRDVSGNYAEAIRLINLSDCPVIAVDIPSGLNADTGYLMGCVVKANYTASFIGLKQGILTGLAAEYCGEIICDTLDIPDEVFLAVEHASQLITQAVIPTRFQYTHKGDNGHVLVVGGDTGFSGAIRLAAEAALRIGAGLVSIATRKTHAYTINIGRPELMSHAIENMTELTPLLKKATVVIIGPGMGQSHWGQSLFNQVVQTDKPLVMDADALNLLAKKTFSSANWVLTPHPGEAARLLSCSTLEISKDRFSAVAKLQQKYKGVVVLKGAGTLIHCGEEISISTTGNPGMATAGMGDTLSGMIAGLIAQNMSLAKAASTAVFLHGKASDLSAQQMGEIGLLASDLMPYIRKLINE